VLIGGTITIGDDIELTGLSARFTSDKFEYLFRFPDDTFMIAELTTTDGLPTITIRDSQFTWLCSNDSCATM
jgi:hypothetical protein